MKQIEIIECKVSCHTCGTPLPDTHPACVGTKINRAASLRSEIVSLRSQKKQDDTGFKIILLKQQLLELGLEMPVGEELPP